MIEFNRREHPKRMHKSIIRRPRAKLLTFAADGVCMLDRRIEPRMLCADLIDVHWKDKSGQNHSALANLEDISISGLCLQMDIPVPHETRLRIAHPKTELEGRVRYCVFRETGYFLGVQFEPGFRWTQRRFRPKHLLDPRHLVAQSVKRALRKRNGDRPPATA